MVDLGHRPVLPGLTRPQRQDRQPVRDPRRHRFRAEQRHLRHRHRADAAQIVHGLALDSDTDEDWFKVTTGSGIGTDKYLRMVTEYVGELYPDTAIELYDACTEGNLLAASNPTASSFWMDALIYDTPLTSITTYYIKVKKGSHAGGGNQLGAYSFEVSIDTVPATGCDNTAVALTLPYSSATPLTLTSASAVNWYRFTAAAGDVGKTLSVVTKPGDLHTDTFLELYDSTCGTRRSRPRTTRTTSTS